MINTSDKNNFNENLKTIIKQIKQIENLVNEFSDFARMPKPIFKENNLVEIIELEDHPWFLAGQFHPEFKSSPMEPHPLFTAFISSSRLSRNGV